MLLPNIFGEPQMDFLDKSHITKVARITICGSALQCQYIV